MTDIASGVAKRVAYKVESTWGTAPGASGAQYLRRVQSSLGLKKATYQSAEIRSDYQRNDMRHGVRSVEGVISGELSAGTYKDFMAAAVRKAFAAVSAMASLSLTIAGSGPTYTVARGSGSWITDGVKLGDVLRLSVGSLNAANINKNLVVCAETASTLTVMPLNGVALVAEGPIATCTATVYGKKTYVPTTGHTDLSYSIEHYYADIAQSELFTGCKVSGLSVKLPPSGMATADIEFMGKDVTTASSAYYTSPTAETTSGSLAAVNGLLIASGSAIALVTGLSFDLKGNHSAEAVVGSNTYGGITEGRVIVSGQVTALFQDATMRDYFLNETEVGLSVVLSASTSATADFIGFSMPRVKFTSGAPDDGEKSLILTMGFEALYNNAGGASTTTEQSTLVIQDSAA